MARNKLLYHIKNMTLKMKKTYLSPTIKMLGAVLQPTMLTASIIPEPEPEPEFDVDTNLEGLGGYGGGSRSVWAD